MVIQKYLQNGTLIASYVCTQRANAREQKCVCHFKHVFAIFCVQYSQCMSTSEFNISISVSRQYKSTSQGAVPLPAQRRLVEITWASKIPPTSPLGYAMEPNHIKFMSSSDLAPMWNPHISESAELAQWSLSIISQRSTYILFCVSSLGSRRETVDSSVTSN